MLYLSLNPTTPAANCCILRASLLPTIQIACHSYLCITTSESECIATYIQLYIAVYLTLRINVTTL